MFSAASKLWPEVTTGRRLARILRIRTIVAVDRRWDRQNNYCPHVRNWHSDKLAQRIRTVPTRVLLLLLVIVKSSGYIVRSKGLTALGYPPGPWTAPLPLTLYPSAIVKANIRWVCKAITGWSLRRHPVCFLGMTGVTERRYKYIVVWGWNVYAKWSGVVNSRGPWKIASDTFIEIDFWSTIEFEIDLELACPAQQTAAISKLKIINRLLQTRTRLNDICGPAYMYQLMQPKHGTAYNRLGPV